jgi:hypothetical protein
MGFDTSHCKRKLSNVAFQDFEHQGHDLRHDLLRNNLYCDRMHAACRYNITARERARLKVASQ